MNIKSNRKKARTIFANISQDQSVLLVLIAGLYTFPIVVGSCSIQAPVFTSFLSLHALTNQPFEPSTESCGVLTILISYINGLFLAIAIF